MGYGTIASRTNGQTIDQTWFNILRTALSVDFVPRDITGAVTDVAGSLGDTTYAWLTAYLTSLNLRSNGNYVNLAAPTGLAASYNLKLPGALPASSSKVAVDTAGNLSFVVGAPVVSASCGNFTNNSNTPTAVTNLSVTIATTGRPVWIGCISDGTNINANFGAVDSTQTGALAIAEIFQGTTKISRNRIYSDIGGATANSIFVPPSSINTIDQPVAGTYTYTVKLYGNASGTNTAFANGIVLVAYEL